MTALPRRRHFRRLESDSEFRARLLTLKRKVWDMTHAVHQHGQFLDDWAWDKYRVQRRIVEVEG
jgi:hypothetical protein